MTEEKQLLEEKVKNKIERWDKGGAFKKASLDGDPIFDVSPDDDDETAYMTIYESLLNFIEEELATAKAKGAR